MKKQTKSGLVSAKPQKDQGALAVQVGGGHYKKLAIQPVEYSMKNKLNFCQGNIVKYATRYADKGDRKKAVEDLRKVKHYVDLLIELEYADILMAEQQEAAKLEKAASLKSAKAKKSTITMKQRNRKNELARLSRIRKKNVAPKRVKPAGPIPNYMKPLNPSADLAKIIGDKPIARTDAVRKLWVYIKKHNLQKPSNKRTIVADELLKPVFGGRSEVTMFDLAALLGKHLT